jgi:hypothetical protein
MLLTEGFLGWWVWAEVWVVCEVWAVKPRFYKDFVFKVGRGRGQGGGEGFEFARGGEGEGKGGVKGLSSRAEVRDKVSGGCGFSSLMKQNKKFASSFTSPDFF